MKAIYKRIASFVLVTSLLLTLVPSSFAIEGGDVTESSADTRAAVSYNTNGVNFAGVVTPRKDKAIVIIPGVLGSQLKNSSGQMVWNWLGRGMQLECYTNGNSKNTITPYTTDGYGPGDIYKALYQHLQTDFQDSYDILFFSYDWRLNNASSAAQLAIAINNDYDEVILVAHSMGGLVASKYLANSPSNRSKVDKLITIGTPYTGAVKLLNVAEDGDMGVKVNLFVSKSDLKTLMANFHCTYQLAPTTRYNNNYGAYIKVGTVNKSGAAARTFYSQLPWATVDGETKSMYADAETFHNNLIVNGTHIANNSTLVDTYKIVGIGEDTYSKILYDADGNYLDFEANNSGDGTVARYSASNTLAVTDANKVYEYTGEHTGLVKSEDVLGQISDIINGTVESRMSSNPYSEKYEVNEKGWVVGMDNKRIYVVVDESADITILDGSKNALSLDEEGYFVDGESKRVGYMNAIGLGRVKYTLYDDNYTFGVSSAKNIDYIKIEYQNNGYYEYSASYENLPTNSVTIAVSEFAEMTPSVYMANDAKISTLDTISGVIVPTNIMSATQLIERNNY